MQGLILAAGKGSRLGDKSGGIAKCLLEIGRLPLVDHQIEALSGCGVGPVAMVVGYGSDEVQELVGIKAEFIRNPRWSTTNSLYSFWLARDWVKGDVVVLNCDVLFSPLILERLLDTDGDAIAYDSGSGDRKEEMSVRVENLLLTDMSKTMPLDRVSGENVGMLKLSAATARALFDKAGELIEAGREKEWLGAALREVAGSRPIHAIDIHGLPWGEIDFPADLDRARKQVLPAIRKSQRHAAPRMRFLRSAVIAALGLALVLTSYKAWTKPHETVWDSVPARGIPEVVISNGLQSRSWGRFGVGEPASLSIDGPATLRIDVRPLLAGADPPDAHFVLEVQIDGYDRSWSSLTSSPSSTWNQGGVPVGKRQRIEVEVPPGHHEVTAILSAADVEACLVRFAQLDSEL